MKAQILSDLHTEFHGNPVGFVNSLYFDPDLDFLLLLGDTVVFGSQPLDECRRVFECLSTKARHVLFLVGNHEYYGSLGLAQTNDMIRYILPSNFTWLDNSEATLDGVHFYGGAMWFRDDPLNPLYEHELNDFRLIPDIRSWVYQSNTEFRNKGLDLIRPETVVLSHHLPSHLSTPLMYRESNTNRFFVSDESKLILEKSPRLWLHGHTHYPCEYMIGDTKVLCNPHGYPSERRRMGLFNPTMLEV